MPRTAKLDQLLEAHRTGAALVGVNVYDLLGAQAVAMAASLAGRPAIIQTGSSAFDFAGRQTLAAIAIAVRESAGDTMSVHLDHCRKLDEVRFCLDAGYDSVMIDGSHLPLAENIKLTAAAVAIAHSYEAWVEGELGATAGNEDRSTDARAGVLTDPREAVTFVEATGIDALAVAVGNVHGIPSEPPSLSLEVLDAISAAVDVPLVLHGASGLSDTDLRAAVSLGVAKVNINAEVRRAYLTALRNSLSSSTSDDLTSHLAIARLAVTHLVRSRIEMFTVNPQTEGVAS